MKQPPTSSIWLVRAAAYYHRRIGDAPWIVIGNYVAAWIFLAGAAFLIRGYEYQHMLRIWQPLIPIQGPAMLVPGLALLGAYLILPSRLGALPALIVLYLHVHLHQASIPSLIQIPEVIGMLWHITFFPVLILVSLVLIGELTWPFVRAMVAVRHAWSKQRVLAHRLAYERARLATQQQLEEERDREALYLEQQRRALSFQFEQQQIKDQQLTLERRRTLQQQRQDVAYRREQARLVLEHAEVDKLARKANAQLIAPQSQESGEVQVAPLPTETPILASESAT